MILKTDSFKSKMLLGLIGCTVIAIGVYIGIFFSIKTGLATQLNNYTLSSEINNRSKLEIDNKLLSFELLSSSGDMMLSDSLFINKKTIIAFVENGCEPCLIYLEYLKTVDFSNDGYAIALLSSDPAFIQEEFKAYSFTITNEIRDQLEIHTTPTIIGVDQSLTIKFVIGGFSKLFDLEYVSEYL